MKCSLVFISILFSTVLAHLDLKEQDGADINPVHESLEDSPERLLEKRHLRWRKRFGGGPWASYGWGGMGNGGVWKDALGLGSIGFSLNLGGDANKGGAYYGSSGGSNYASGYGHGGGYGGGYVVDKVNYGGGGGGVSFGSSPSYGGSFSGGSAGSWGAGNYGSNPSTGGPTNVNIAVAGPAAYVPSGGYGSGGGTGGHSFSSSSAAASSSGQGYGGSGSYPQGGGFVSGNTHGNVPEIHVIVSKAPNHGYGGHSGGISGGHGPAINTQAGYGGAGGQSFSSSTAGASTGLVHAGPSTSAGYVQGGPSGYGGGNVGFNVGYGSGSTPGSGGQVYHEISQGGVAPYFEGPKDSYTVEKVISLGGSGHHHAGGGHTFTAAGPSKGSPGYGYNNGRPDVIVIVEQTPSSGGHTSSGVVSQGSYGTHVDSSPNVHFSDGGLSQGAIHASSGNFGGQGAFDGQAGYNKPGGGSSQGAIYVSSGNFGGQGAFDGQAGHSKPSGPPVTVEQVFGVGAGGTGGYQKPTFVSSGGPNLGVSFGQNYGGGAGLGASSASSASSSSSSSASSSASSTAAAGGFLPY